jgi:hypothetical protein
MQTLAQKGEGTPDVGVFIALAFGGRWRWKGARMGPPTLTLSLRQSLGNADIGKL